jgi:hypothetical protein
MSSAVKNGSSIARLNTSGFERSRQAALIDENAADLVVRDGEAALGLGISGIGFGERVSEGDERRYIFSCVHGRRW